MKPSRYVLTACRCLGVTLAAIFAIPSIAAAQSSIKFEKKSPVKIGYSVFDLHPGAAVGVPRTKGFVDEIKKHADFKIVASLNGNDTVQGGYQATQNALSANPNLAGIYATNDPEAEGAVQALKAAGKNAV